MVICKDENSCISRKKELSSGYLYEFECLRGYKEFFDERHRYPSFLFFIFTFISRAFRLAVLSHQHSHSIRGGLVISSLESSACACFDRDISDSSAALLKNLELIFWVFWLLLALLRRYERNVRGLSSPSGSANGDFRWSGSTSARQNAAAIAVTECWRSE